MWMRRLAGVDATARGVDAAVRGCGCSGAWVWMNSPIPCLETGLRQRADSTPTPWASRQPFRSSSFTWSDGLVSHPSAESCGVPVTQRFLIHNT
nr:hypothetical protein GCM10023233_29100 [Brevibacterium otitidis]